MLVDCESELSLTTKNALAELLSKWSATILHEVTIDTDMLSDLGFTDIKVNSNGTVDATFQNKRYLGLFPSKINSVASNEATVDATITFNFGD